jgi:hypothetical protein
LRELTPLLRNGNLCGKGSRKKRSGNWKWKVKVLNAMGGFRNGLRIYFKNAIEEVDI